MNIILWIILGLLAFLFLMAGATALHGQRSDGAQAVGGTIVLLLLAAFVAYGRFVLVPA